MSPSKFQVSDVTKGTINGPRPLPLRIKKDSHVIHKHHNAAPKKPVIIYSQSPKVIHTQASEFMSLVQRLTGFNPDEADSAVKPKAEVVVKEESSFSDKKGSAGAGNSLPYDENNGMPSLLSYDKSFKNEMQQNAAMAALPSMYQMSNEYMMEAHAPPLFTPNSNEFFCSSWPNALNTMNPSVMDYAKGFPDY